MLKKSYKVTHNGKDISSYIIKINWHGDIDTSARQLDFEIVYNPKDKNMTLIKMQAGDKITASYGGLAFFSGVIFQTSRDSSSNIFSVSCYDRGVYLAKNKTTRKFKNCSVASVITQACNDVGISVGKLCDGLNTIVNFIADNMSYSEIIQKACSYAKAQNGKDYYYYIDNQEKLCVVHSKQKIDSYVLKADANIDHSNHSESIEDMVNTVMVVDDKGAQVSTVSNGGDVSKYGKMQAVYKVDKKQDTKTQAHAMLKPVDYKSSVSAIGNIQCISGCTITVQDEQLKGDFLITADSHTIENNKHTMDLDLRYAGE